MQRAEGQFRRGLVFGFRLWSFMFWTCANLGTSLKHISCAASRTVQGTTTPMHSGEDFVKACNEVVRALNGVAIVNGRNIKVNHRLHLVRLVPGLSSLAQDILSDYQATAMKASFKSHQ